MSNGWDSCFHNLPPLTSDASLLRRLEPNRNPSQDVENLTGQHEFSSTGALNEASAINPNLNMDCCTKPSIEDPSSDCACQEHYKENHWQADVGQMEKGFSTNSELTDFATDGLSTSGTYPSAFAADIQEINQDCGMLATSFLEDYPDANSCSDADGIEARPSCKFAASSAVLKPKIGVAAKHSSSEWLLPQTGDLTLQSESQCPLMSETNKSVQRPLDTEAGGHINQSAHGIVTFDKTINHHAKEDQHFTIPGMLTTESEIVEDKNANEGCQIQSKKNQTENKPEETSHIQKSASKNINDDRKEEYPNGKNEKQSIENLSSMVVCMNKHNEVNEIVTEEAFKPLPCQETMHLDDSSFPKGQTNGGEKIQKDESCVTKGEQRELEAETVQDRNDDSGFQIQHPINEPEENKGVTSHSQISAAENMSHAEREEFPDGVKEEKIPEATSNAIEHEQDHIGYQVLSKNINLSPDQENDGRNERKVIRETLEKDIVSDQNSLNSNSKDVQGQSTKTSCAKTDIQASTSKSVDEQENEVHDDGDYIPEERECTSAVENNAVEYQFSGEIPEKFAAEHFDSYVADHLKESCQGLENSTKESSVFDIFYTEPLSREDSSCDAGETEHEFGHNGDLPVARKMPQLKLSSQMSKLLQPIVIIRTSESTNEKINSFHCITCQFSTNNADQLIEHHHSCHPGQDFQFCLTCKLARIGGEQTKKHICGETTMTGNTQNPQLSSDSGSQEKRKRPKHKCDRCNLRFSKLFQYISHMRTHTGITPYKCKCGSYFAQAGSLTRHKWRNCRYRVREEPVNKASVVISQATTPNTKNLVQEEPSDKVRGCFVKLFDIQKKTKCPSCSGTFSSLQQASKHICNKPKKKRPLVFRTYKKKSLIVKNEMGTNYKCPLCPRLFKYPCNRNRHLRQCVFEAAHSSKGRIDGKFKCPLCSINFTQSTNRYRHLRTLCLGEFIRQLGKGTLFSQKVKAEKTNKERDKIENIKQEPLMKTTNIEPRYKCTLCPAVFLHPSGKYKHMRKHELSKLTGITIKYRKSVFSTSKPEKLVSKKPEESKTKSVSDGDSSKKPEEGKTKSVSDGDSSSPSKSCHFCGKSFTTLESLKKHERNHRGEKPYQCLQCGKRFKKLAHLVGHKVVHQRRIQCTVCRKILPTIGELIQHRSTHLKRGVLKCPDCDMEFQYPAHLLRHLPTHKKKEERESQCDEKLPVKPQPLLGTVKENQNQNTSEPKQHQCSLCKEIFDDNYRLRKHCLTHITGSENQCPFCNRKYDCRRYLVRHMIRHSSDRSFSCTNCGKQFCHNFSLKIHHRKCLPPEILKDPEPKSSFQCSYCPRVFAYRHRLIKHDNSHKNNTLVLCSGCGMYFGARRLKEHQEKCLSVKEPCASASSSNDRLSQKSHPVQKMSLKCVHCSQNFRYRSYLLRHLVTHTRVYPFTCSRCGKGFLGQKPCTLHEALCEGTQAKVKPEVKSNAAKQSSVIPTLKEEVQTPQEGGGQVKCTFCTKTFIKSRNLRRHILTHNGVKPYRCKVCDGCFSRYDHLKVHLAHCKGNKPRLEVCIPKISLNDIGKGWQSKFGLDIPTKPKTFDCKTCAKSFSTQTVLLQHTTLYHTVKLFTCQKCGSSFTHENNLKKHRKMRRCRNVLKAKRAALCRPAPLTENLPQPPPVVQNTVLQGIQPRSDRRNTHSCSYCPRTFKCNFQLILHTRLHTGEKPFGCNDCGEKFIRKDYLKRHYPKCSKKGVVKKVLCDGCGGFFSQLKLEDHKKNCVLLQSSSESAAAKSKQTTPQSPPKGFSCAYCSSRFLLFSQLQEHFVNAHKMETVVPPVSTAPLQQHLSNISRVNEGSVNESASHSRSESTNVICKLDTVDLEEPTQYSCTECDMVFSCYSGLASHRRAHKTEQPFKCKTCNRGFWNKNFHRIHSRKCRRASKAGDNIPLQPEGPLKVEMDFAPNDSVLEFKDGSRTSGTGVSCQEEVANDSQQKSEEKQVQSSAVKEKKTVLYQCSECDQSFTDGLMLISHLEDHGRQEQEKKRNACAKCGKLCSSPAHLQKHMRTLHSNREGPSCPDCSMNFDSLSELEIHRTCHDSNRPYACKICKQRFWTRPSLANHVTESHPEEVYKCRYCNKPYTAKKSLYRHYKGCSMREVKERNSQNQSGYEKQTSSQHSATTAESDSEENRSSGDSDSDSAPYFPCHVCGKTFPTSESLEDHQRCHLGEKPHECAECGKCFFQASQLQQHQRMHKSEFQCQLCSRGFVSLFALRKHKHSHGKSRPYRCSKCHLSFTGPLQLAEHMSNHQEESFPCDICNRVFPSKSSRAEHRKSHMESDDHRPPAISKEGNKKPVFHPELKYRCGVCSEHFRDPEELSEHGCFAAQERQYSCPDCDKHFLHSSHLKKHRATHEVSWSSCEYPCNQCNSSFSSSKDFLRHAKSHVAGAAGSSHRTESRDSSGASHSFICPVCHQCFATAAELIQHFPMHPDGTYECKICKISLPSERKLEEHERSHLTSATEFECTECGQSFLGSSAFFQHRCSPQKSRVKQTKDSYPQTVAPPQAYHEAAGDEEEVDVTGEDVFDCPVCSMRFSSIRSLLEHQNANHTENKPFMCEGCGRKFSLRKYLKQHEKKHCPNRMSVQVNNQWVVNKPKCSQCQIEFETEEDLSLHMRLHTEKEGGEYRCDMCYKSFSQGSLLRQHQESHVGQIVYECDYCDKAFAFPHLLEEHQQTHAGSF